MDVLADIVSGLELRSSLYFRAEFSECFAVAVPEDRRRIRFHVAGCGRSWVGLPSGEWREYGDGDLILIPHGSAHILASDRVGTALALEEVLAESPLEGGRVLRHGGGGATAALVCGHFEFDERVVHPLIESLPPLIHLDARSQPGFGWMPALLTAVESEGQSGQPASDAIARRLSEVLFIQVMRAVVSRAAVDGGLLASIDDPQLGRALRCMHGDAAADWSLERLASEAGLSRSVFADRFRERIGVTPIRYLTDWRMQKARKLLGDDSLSVSDVGRRVGYASEAAFNRAFRDSVGEPPGRHRRALQRTLA